MHVRITLVEKLRRDPALYVYVCICVSFCTCVCEIECVREYVWVDMCMCMGVCVQNDTLDMDNEVRFSSGMRETTLQGVVVVHEEHQDSMLPQVSSWDRELDRLLR